MGLSSCLLDISAQDKISVDNHSYTEEYITAIYLETPERALQLLDEAEKENAMPLNIINDLRSMSYRNMFMHKPAFIYARKAYVNDSIQNKDPLHLLKMTTALAEISLLLSEHGNSIRYATEGIQQARKLGDKYAEAKLLFCLGENKRLLSFKGEGYDYFDRAIGLLNDSSAMSLKMLSYFYGVKMGYLIDDSEFQKAFSIGLERERLINKMSLLKEYPSAYIDRQFAYAYTKLAYIAYKLGKYAQAEKYFGNYSSTKSALIPDGEYDAVPYLLLTGRYEDVLKRCKAFRTVLKGQNDTLSLQYISILQREIDANVGLKDFKRVADLRESVIRIVSAMRERDLRDNALQLDAIYRIEEKDRCIAEQGYQLKIRTVLLTSITGILLLILFYLWNIRSHNYIIKAKNKVLVRFINERLAEESGKIANIDEEAFGISEPNEDGEYQGKGEETEEEENKLLFNKLNDAILHDKLYLSPELSREELVRIVRVNNTRFAKMIKDNTGTNLNGYINNLRLKHAVQLLKEHPNYTMKAIAEESGFNSMPTFHTLFKKRTGMTPFEFKNAQKELQI